MNCRVNGTSVEYTCVQLSLLLVTLPSAKDRPLFTASKLAFCTSFPTCFLQRLAVTATLHASRPYFGPELAFRTYLFVTSGLPQHGVDCKTFCIDFLQRAFQDEHINIV